MADAQQSIRSIAGSMIARARQQTLQKPDTLVGRAYEAVTSQIKDYNEQVEKLVRAETRAKQLDQEIAEVQRKLAKRRDEINKGLAISQKTRERLAKLNEAERAIELDKIRERQAEMTAKLRREEAGLLRKRDENNVAISRTTSNIKEMERHNSLLGNGLGILAAKVAGLTASFFSLRDALQSVDQRVRFAGKNVALASVQIAQQGVAAESTWQSIKRLAHETWEWNSTISDTVAQLGRMGISAQDAYGMLGGLTDGIRTTVAQQGQLRDFAGQAATNIGHMATLLQVNTEELATATVGASKRFGKGVGQMSDELAGMFVEIGKIRQGSRDAVVDFRDITRAALEAQASFQGYNLNLRTTASILGGLTAKMQEQGATYEMAQKGAEGLFGVLAGGKAPDWAKFMAGKDLQREVRSAIKGIDSAFDQHGHVIAGTAEKLRAALMRDGISSAKDMSDVQLANLQDLANNWSQYGELSSANMTEEMLRGSKSGMRAMLEIMQKTSKGPEMREVLKRVWGLDDQAATAATLALRRGGFDAMMDQMQALKIEAEDRKPVTIGSVRAQTQEFVNAIGIASNGIDGLKALIGSIFANPINATLAGIGSMALSGLLQALQMGAGVAVAGAFQNSGMLGKLGEATGKFGGLAKGMGKATLRMGAWGLAAAAAGKVGWEMGKELRRLYPEIDDSFQFLFENIAKLADGFLGLREVLSEEEAARRGFASVMEAQNEAGERTRRVFKTLTHTLEGRASAEQEATAVRFLKSFKKQDLEDMAQRIAKTTILSQQEALLRLQGLQARPVTLPVKPKQESVAKGARIVAPDAPQTARRAMQEGRPALLDQLRRAAPQRPPRAPAGAERQGRTAVGPDGSIKIEVNIPRDALDKSAYEASANTG